MRVSPQLNGKPCTFDVPDGTSLLELIRDHAGLTSPKDGCSPQGQCGCCVVLVDGKPKISCGISAASADGKAVLTLEGIDAEERSLYAEAFARTAGLQCGFCIPGIVMRMKSVLDKSLTPTSEEIAKKLDVHLCRCTGYTKIVDAFHAAAAARRGEGIPGPDPTGRVGTSLDRFEAEALALGARDYVADMVVPDMLHGALALSPHARAKVVRIDTTKARALPGVHSVVTWRDVPGKRHYGLLYDDWPGFVAEGEETKCVGDVLAAVAAVDARTARAAAALVEVELEVLTPVTDPEAALDEGAPVVGPHGNLLSVSRLKRGDAVAALAASAHVVDRVFETQRIEHLYLEPEACLAVPGDPAGGAARMTLYTQGQGIFDDRRQVAGFLAWPEEDLHVVLVPNGGAFGGKEDMSCQSQTALLCHVTGRPVRLVMSREESMRMHPKRHPIKMHYRVGCDAQGMLTAVWARMIGDGGAYASVSSKVLERASGHASGAYDVPNVDVEARAVYTNNPVCGAMRGFGANQAQFAMESCVQMLADACGIDGWTFRYQNALEVGDTFSTGQILEKSVGLKKTLEAVKDQFFAHPGRAGIACGIKNSGIGNGVPEWGKARLVVDSADHVSLYNGYTEMGQGLFTVLIQCACEVTGLPARVFTAKVETRHPLACGQTTGSRATLFGGKAVILAAQKLKAELDAGKTLADLVGQTFEGAFLCDDTTKLGADVKKIKTHTAFGFATQLVILDDQGKLAKVVAAHDVGKAINPKLCEGQIEGSVHMGLGYALTEDMPCVDGMPVTFKLRDYGVLRAHHMPEVEVVMVEDHEPEGPFGAKGVGEIGLVPTAGAVANALAAFDGVRRLKLPMKDSPAARAMKMSGAVPREDSGGPGAGARLGARSPRATK